MSTLVVWRVPRIGRWVLQPRAQALSARLRRALPRRRTLKLVALGYVVKTLLFAAAWYVVPDLPQRIYDRVQAAWDQLGLSR